MNKNTFLTLLGIFSIIYSLLILSRVATDTASPVHCNPSSSNQEMEWLVIQETDSNLKWYGVKPSKGDYVHKIGNRKVVSLLQLAREVNLLNGREPEQTNVSEAELNNDLISTGTGLIVDSNNERWAQLTYSPRDKPGNATTAWFMLQGIPKGTILLSVIWFLLKMTVLVIGYLVVRKRPDDFAAIVFYFLCCITVVAFMGGVHWASIAASEFLFTSFIVAVVLAAPTTLHFYLLFPAPYAWVKKQQILSLLLIYAIPACALGFILLHIVLVNLSFGDIDGYYNTLALHPAAQEVQIDLLTAYAGLAKLTASIEIFVGVYVGFSALLFLCGLAVLGHRFITSKTKAEQNQVTWILYAAMVATLLFGWLLYKAEFEPYSILFGAGTKPLIIGVSVWFTVAYAFSITRYRLMQASRLLNRGFLYIIIGLAFMAIFGVFVALSNKQVVGSTHVVIAGLIVVAGLAVMRFLLEKFYRAAELRLVRDKFHLDKAMKRLGAAVEQLVEPNALVEQMLQSIIEMTSATGGVVYLRDEADQPFEKVYQSGSKKFVDNLPEDHTFVSHLLHVGVLPTEDAQDYPSFNAVRSLRSLGGEYAYTIVVNSKVVGILVLAEKAEERKYSTEDRNFILALVRTTAFALQNAQGHQTIERLREDLQQKVDEIAEHKQRILFLQGELMNRNTDTLTVGETNSLTSSKGKKLKHSIIGSSEVMGNMLKRVGKISQSSASVLIRGDSGTGKELFAKAIHDNSERVDGPFVAVHCASFSSSLLESELFGHVKGAFTGADRKKIGRFEKADCGTLFLDEIGDIDLDTQTKLLRVLQERSFERVGGTEPIEVDVRVIAATHRNLEELIQFGQFREDLFYRLNVISLNVPPLRDRQNDVIELSMHFLRQFCKKSGKRIQRIDPDALEILSKFPWPGNVRQLENAIERAVVLADRESISINDLPPELLNPSIALVPDYSQPTDLLLQNSVTATEQRTLSHPIPKSSGMRPMSRIAEVEKQELINALQLCGGNKSKAAKMLGVPRSTLYSKLKKHGI